jgi:LemA protein
MMKGKWIAIGLAAVILILALSGFGSFNRLVGMDEQVNKQWSDVGTYLQRRADLIPNLVRTVEGYTRHEKEVLAKVSEARAKLAGAGTADEQIRADNELSGALARLLMVVENYPNLKADTQFTQLMDELAGTENRITIARKDYNQAAQAYNEAIRRFPTMIYAQVMGFDAKPYFEADQKAAEAPKVDFGAK